MVALKKEDNWIDTGIINPSGVPTIRFLVLEFIPYLGALPYLDKDTEDVFVFRKREDAVKFGKEHSLFGFRIVGMSKDTWEEFKKIERYICVDGTGKRVEDQS